MEHTGLVSTTRMPRIEVTKHFRLNPYIKWKNKNSWQYSNIH